MHSGLSVKTAPAAEPVTLDDLKAHLRVTDNAEDAYITRLGQAARAHIEDVCNRVALTTVFTYTVDKFPCDTRMIELPISTLQSVASVKYYDEDGVLQTLDAGQYYVIIDQDPGFIFLKDAYFWPTTECGRPRAVVIEFSAGWEDDVAGLAALRDFTGFTHAIKFLVQHWFDNRAHIEQGRGINVTKIPDTLDDLVQQFRVFTLS